MKRTSILLILFSLLVATACKKKETEEEQVDSFDKKSLLANVADNLVLPQYLSFQTELGQLQVDYQSFLSNPDALSLQTVRDQLVSTYLSWQSAKIFEIGPAQQIGLRSSIGTFPSDSVRMASNISAGSYNLSTADNADAIGLSAIEFMLFRANALSYFSDAAYQQYGTDVINKMVTEFGSVVSQWQSGYRDTFVNGTGTESTSAFSQLVNEFNKDYELCKSAELGIPMGKYSLGILRPDYIEARNSAISLQLVEETMRASQRLFNGNSVAGATGIGFDDYLAAIDKSNLAAGINAKYDEIFVAKNALNGSLEYNLNTNFNGLDNLYLKVSEMVVMIKTDMASSFGVLITYQDNDGD